MPIRCVQQQLLSKERPTHLTTRTLAMLAILAFFVASCAGCVTLLEKTRFNAADIRFEIDRADGPAVSVNAAQILRENGFAYPLNEEELTKVRDLLDFEPSADLVYAYAESAYLLARKLEKKRPRRAAELYADVVRFSWHFLFNPSLANARERASWNGELADVVLLYNGSTERLLHFALQESLQYHDDDFPFLNDQDAVVSLDDDKLRVKSTVQKGSWTPDEYEEFRLATDCAVKPLKLDCRQSGLGVPLVVQRRTSATAPRNEEKYYPSSIFFPSTAILRPNPYRPLGALPPIENPSDSLSSDENADFELDFYDPLSTADFSSNNTTLPLEADFTTPIAYFLTTCDKLNSRAARHSLLKPETLHQTIEVAANQERQLQGLYLLEPYNPNKIPVVMTHGLGSSPATWMEMYNALRSVKEIRDGFQFWFFFYPTGQPFWASAATLRSELTKLRELVDPTRQADSLDDVVLIGHSMGGLVSRMQVQASGEKIWNLVSSKPFDEFNFDDDARQKIEEWFFFEPNPSIKRVITIATPFKGSRFANSFTSWVADRAIAVPQTVSTVLLAVTPKRRQKEEKFDPTLLNISTSVQSLDPDCPLFKVLDQLEIPDDVVLNNIVGVIPKLEERRFNPKKSDGVVDFESARRFDVETETETPAPHTTVHAHFDSINQTRNLLIRHLNLYKEKRRLEKNDLVKTFENDVADAPLPPTGYLSVAPVEKEDANVKEPTKATTLF